MLNCNAEFLLCRGGMNNCKKIFLETLIGITHDGENLYHLYDITLIRMSLTASRSGIVASTCNLKALASEIYYYYYQKLLFKKCL